MLWQIMTSKNTDKNARKSNGSNETDRDDDMEINDKFKEREWNKSSQPS